MTFSYEWNLSDLNKIPKKNIKVFSAFAGGGGSSMGYKMARFDVIGCLEIDPKINAIYRKNLNPRFNFCEDIRDFNKRTDLPEELFGIDILDGSPPCSSFSMAGKREKDWGKKKKFREGQSLQILDDLFFHFLDTVDLLKPKIFIAENVKGLIFGNAKEYAIKIIERAKEIGYEVQLFLLNAATMGVPQKRERVFFIGHKKELDLPKLKMRFNERPIYYGSIKGSPGNPLTSFQLERWKYGNKTFCSYSEACLALTGRISGFSYDLVGDKDILPTATTKSDKFIRRDIPFQIGIDDWRKAQSFPKDYQKLSHYILGMSVPPMMIYKIAKEIERQWLEKHE